MDTAALETAYRALLGIASAGGFRPPADSTAPTAEQHLAAVIATDRLLAATTADVLAGRPASHDDAAASDPTYLAVIGRAAGGHEPLVATLRQCGLELVLLARRLDASHAATVVPTRLVDAHGGVKVDAPLPWVATLTTHAEVALPARAAALRALR